MVDVDLSRTVNSFKLICIPQLGLTYCVTHFKGQNENPPRELRADGTQMKPLESSLLSGRICVLCLRPKKQTSPCEGLFPSSPGWSRGFGDFEICFVELMSWEQVLLFKRVQLRWLKMNQGW